MRFIENQEVGARCSLLLVTEDGRHLRCGAAPNLPESYRAGLDHVPIGPPYIGTCGEVIHLSMAVSVPDVAADMRFAPEWRELLLTHGLHAVRSTPVCHSDGTVMASFAFYRDRPSNPEPYDPDLIALATSLAAVVLEHSRTEEALRKASE